MIQEKGTISDDQLRYAAVLGWGTKFGFALLVGSFAAYVAGLLPGLIPIESMPGLWTLPARAYLERTGTDAGWFWALHVAHGEFASLLGIAVLAGCAVPGLAGLIPHYVRVRDFAYAAICASSIGVVLLAATGLLTTAR